MREIRLSGSEGGGLEFNRFSLPLSKSGSVRPHSLFTGAGRLNHQRSRITAGRRPRHNKAVVRSSGQGAGAEMLCGCLVNLPRESVRIIYRDAGNDAVSKS
jgi:hypothetical protein